MAIVVIGVGGYLSFKDSNTLTEIVPWNCTPSVGGNLEHSCRPWFGVWVNGYIDNSTVREHVLRHEELIQKQFDIIHFYHPPGKYLLSDDERYFYNRDNTYLYINWKPTLVWSEAAGDNAAINESIDQMAREIKALGAKKLFLTVFHEPENDVSHGAEQCKELKGTSGTPADYIAMWRTVRERFDTLGVRNVVWTMNYMGFSQWDCMINALWPGNEYVDWVTYDPFSSRGQSYQDTVGRFYNVLESSSDAKHNYISKPWGLAEFGVNNYSDTFKNSFYQQALGSIERNEYPRLKLYMVFDAIGTDDDFRIFVNQDKRIDWSSAPEYLQFVSSKKFKD